MDHRDLATELLKTARAAGADAADVLVAEGTEFSVTVRKGEVETLTEAGSKALGLRVFVGKRTATSYTSDFSPAALASLVAETVAMARATGEDAAAGLPDETETSDEADLGLYDPSPAALPTAARIEHARRAEAAALGVSPEITNSEGASFGSGEDEIALANSRGFVGSYRSSSVSMSVVPVGERAGQKQRDYWYSSGRGLGDLLAPEEVGRIAAERTLRRLGARKVKTGEVPVVFDPETAAELLGHVFGGALGLRRLPRRDVPQGPPRRGGGVATAHAGRRRPPAPRPRLAPVRRRGPADAPQRAARARRAPPLAVRLVLGSQDRRAADGPARRGVGGGPSVGRRQPLLRAGETQRRDEIIGGVARGLYVTDLIGFGVNLVTGDYSQGAVGPLDRERPPRPPGPRGHDRRQPKRDAAGRGRGRDRPRIPRRLGRADAAHPAHDGEWMSPERALVERTLGVERPGEGP